ncbi:MAG: outer membrane lipoprotein carrier protein LolA [Bacteroidales bacterium]|jgi:outer membrane lipoprotein-sorting protein|nr:outer membrane lipoprotein carrier protein LolA [Bacteroidales bacterium]
MMYCRFVMFCFCLAGMLLPVASQDGYRQVSGAEAEEMRRNITAASAGMKTLRCDFVQTKTLSLLSEDLISTGFMTYRQPDMLHWEYVTPYHYVFALNGEKVIIESGENRSEIDVASGKLFREISAVIVSGINGRDIFNPARFGSQLMTGKDGCLVMLTPVQKEIRRIFDGILLYFNTRDYTVDRVEIRETGGDKTTIVMKNKKINTTAGNEMPDMD